MMKKFNQVADLDHIPGCSSFMIGGSHATKYGKNTKENLTTKYHQPLPQRQKVSSLMLGVSKHSSKI